VHRVAAQRRQRELDRRGNVGSGSAVADGMGGAKAGEIASRLVANPKIMMQQDLQNFKEIIEGKATPE
jgi:serine/threonine protein phosphatase PrpC